MIPGDPSVTSTWCNHGPAAVPGEPGVNRVSETVQGEREVVQGERGVTQGESGVTRQLQWAASVGDSLEADAGAVQGEPGVTRQL